jgi:hypothetical protein
MILKFSAYFRFLNILALSVQVHQLEFQRSLNHFWPDENHFLINELIIVIKRVKILLSLTWLFGAQLRFEITSLKGEFRV